MGEKTDIGENITLPLMKKQHGFFESFVRIRVTRSNAAMLGLADPNIIQIGNIEWIRENSIYNSYLFFISSLLFDVSDVSILRTHYGGDDMDEATTWEKINPDEEIAGGVYLLQLSDPKLNIHPVLIVRGGGSRTTTPVDASPMPSSSYPSPLKIKANMLATSTVSVFTSTIKSRDKGCIVYGTNPRLCICSHIIPRSLLKQQAYNLTIGLQIIIDEWHPLIGVLLSPDLDKHFNIFELSFYIASGGKTVVHVFKSDDCNMEEDYTPSAWAAIGRTLRFPLVSAHRKEILLWHYKHSLINGWGSGELQAKLRTFEDGEEDYGVAEMYSLGDHITPLPSSPCKDFY